MVMVEAKKNRVARIPTNGLPASAYEVRGLELAPTLRAFHLAGLVPLADVLPEEAVGVVTAVGGTGHSSPRSQRLRCFSFRVSISGPLLYRNPGSTIGRAMGRASDLRRPYTLSN